jgi:hypothetical protein
MMYQSMIYGLIDDSDLVVLDTARRMLAQSRDEVE